MSLSDDFARYFDVAIANADSAQRDAVHRIRYRVYCEEFAYEAPSTEEAERETDAFDDQAIHCLITHWPTGRPAGCIRVVIADRDGLLPMETFCAESLDQGIFAPLTRDRTAICEVSRLAVDAAFRRRSGEKATRFGNPEAAGDGLSGARVFPMISVAAFFSATAVSELIGRKHCFAMMEPFLPRLLARWGIVARKVGHEIEYHGKRAPYCMRPGDVIDNMDPEMRRFYLHVRGVLEKSLSAQPPGRGRQYPGRFPATSSPAIAAPSALRRAVAHQGRER